jgi:hypothetical protein
MEEEDITDRFRAMLTDLYPGEAIQAPPAIVIGGDAPCLAIDFGIVKEGRRWRVPTSFRDMAEPVLLREAFRAGFHAKTAKAPSMVHACNWFAWKSVKDKATRKKFFDTWLAACVSERPAITLYSQPAAWIQEIDKALDIEPRELHELLRRFSSENERLLGKELRYDAVEFWAFNKAIERLSLPEPTLIELLYAHTAHFLKNCDIPSKGHTFEQVTSRPRFGSPPPMNQLSQFYPAFVNFTYMGIQANISLIKKRYVYFFFVPAPEFRNLDWYVLFRIPGMFLTVHECQGGLMLGGEGIGQVCLARYIVPMDSIEMLLEFLSALAAHGFFSSHRAYVCSDGLFTVNFNSYVPYKMQPAFTIDPIRKDPDLLLSTMLEYNADPRDADDFLSCVVKEGTKEIRAFIDKAYSSFSVSMARHDSWLSSMARIANVSPITAKRWLDLLTNQFKFLVPEPRCSYLFNPLVPAFSRLIFMTQTNMTATERTRLASMFPSSFSTTLRGIKTQDLVYWLVYVPRRQLNHVIRLVNEVAPGFNMALIIKNPLVKIGMTTLGWFDGKGYDKATAAIQLYTNAVPLLARGDYSLSEYQNRVTRPIEEIYSTL